MKHTDLVVWQKAMDLVTEVYKLSESFPVRENYGLTSQLQRAAVSIPSNIAEGHGRKSTQAYLNHLSIAHGSLMEVETQVEIARRLGYLSAHPAQLVTERTAEVGRMLNALQRALVVRKKSPHPESRILHD
ncbi:MAG TPA: four helix bundle protein [Burkholderiales bacterium]|nr:four helix bundle protein [Burkholderiales bacterium]